MTSVFTPSPLLTPLISSAAMRAVVDDRAHLQRMLDFVAALARAEAAVAAIPAGSVGPISAACKAERYDLAALGEAAMRAGNVATPLLAALAEEVAKTDAEAARYVHWGATTQDLIDSALMLALRAGIDVLIADLNTAIDGFTTLAGRHRRTAAVARASLQHALPMPFGLKLAGYAAALARSRERLRRLRKEALALQFGGAAGTLAALGENGLAVTDRLAALLDLPAPDAPWHAHSDRLAEIASAFAILTGTCGKIARDVALLMQTEVGEAHEPRGRPPAKPSACRTSAAPTPRPSASRRRRSRRTCSRRSSPARCRSTSAGSAAGRRNGMPSPRCCSSPPARWPPSSSSSQGLEADADRMRTNLDIAQGLIMTEAVTTALSAKLGAQQAKLIVEEASRQTIASKRHLNSILAEDPRVSAHMTPASLRDCSS